MAKKKKEIKPTAKHQFDENIENAITNIVVDSEFSTAQANQKSDNQEFEQLIDILELKRTEKNYDWMSDITLPAFVSILLTNASGWAGQLFQSRDFVDVKLEGDEPNDEAKCRGAKKCINKILNTKDIYHYHKYLRARIINALCGHVYAICWWEQKTKPVLLGKRIEKQPLGIDIYGNELIDETIQQRAFAEKEVDVWGEQILKDRFNYEVIDPRNVFTDDKYCYSIQQKDWVIVRVERTYEDLLIYKNENEYFNLDIVKEAAKSASETDTAKETYREGEDIQQIDKTPSKYFDVLIRFGKFWSIVKERDMEGNPIKIEPGIDTYGEILKDAELIETIITYAMVGNRKILVGLKPTEYIDNLGNTFKPLIRGWCYIHPTKDRGLSSGRYSRELQVAIDDTFNMNVDRVSLATIPTFKGNKHALEDNSSVYMEPEHVILLDNPQTDLMELEIKDNTSGALNQISMLENMLERVTATYPTTMGELPAKASTTATAVSGAESRTNARTNYESLTFEYTWFTEFYWIMLQLLYRFAKDATKIKLMGEDAQYFSPAEDYVYTPVTSNIETEHNRYKKLQLIDQFIGRLAAIQNPKIVKLLNYLLGKAFELFGDEFPKYKENLLDENAVSETGGMGNVQNSSTPTSNQAGVEQSVQEQSVRANMGGLF